MALQNQLIRQIPWYQPVGRILCSSIYFLKGDVTGIDLAKELNQKNIPFVYLSANSNAATLESAIATKPYGFLIKPFREREILIALDIAIYRHQKNGELTTRQHDWLASLLNEVITLEENRTTKIQSFIKALLHSCHLILLK